MVFHTQEGREIRFVEEIVPLGTVPRSYGYWVDGIRYKKTGRDNLRPEQMVMVKHVHPDDLEAYTADKAAVRAAKAEERAKEAKSLEDKKDYEAYKAKYANTGTIYVPGMMTNKPQMEQKGMLVQTTLGSLKPGQVFSYVGGKVHEKYGKTLYTVKGHANGQTYYQKRGCDKFGWADDENTSKAIVEIMVKDPGPTAGLVKKAVAPKPKARKFGTSLRKLEDLEPDF